MLFPTQGVQLDMQDGEVIVYDNFFSPTESATYYKRLEKEIAWRQDTIKFYGKEIPIPRLQAWYGDQGKAFKYSGILLEPLAWIPVLSELKERIEKASGVKYNSVLVNWYRDGKDSVAWHADDEPELGVNPVIGSISFGGTRRFSFKHKTNKELDKINIDLTSGNFLIMRGETQHKWLHAIPKTKKSVAPRINLTFRVIK